MEETDRSIKVSDAKVPAYLGITRRRWTQLKRSEVAPLRSGQTWAGSGMTDFWWSHVLDSFKESAEGGGRRYRIEGRDALEDWGSGRRQKGNDRRGIQDRSVPVTDGRRLHIRGLDD